jgi:hypothetical protein
MGCRKQVSWLTRHSANDWSHTGTTKPTIPQDYGDTRQGRPNLRLLLMILRSNIQKKAMRNIFSQRSSKTMKRSQSIGTESCSPVSHSPGTTINGTLHCPCQDMLPQRWRNFNTQRQRATNINRIGTTPQIMVKRSNIRIQKTRLNL